MTHTSICPVCDMTATDSPIMAEHLGIRYRFCSEQCRANFIARPRLYVGMSVEKEGRKESIKCRKFRLDRDLSSSQTEEIGRALAQLMGVRETKVRKRSIAITYDLLQCRAEQIEACLFAAGIKLGGGWSHRLRLGWIHYAEENELDNLDAPAAACCSRPPAKG